MQIFDGLIVLTALAIIMGLNIPKFDGGSKFSASSHLLLNLTNLARIWRGRVIFNS